MKTEMRGRGEGRLLRNFMTDVFDKIKPTDPLRLAKQAA
jgi:hypothetical protein